MPEAVVDFSEAREFSETIHYSRLVRYRPQEFVDQINRWLLAHPGIVGITASLHRDREGVRSVTFTCQAVLDPTQFRVQMACLPLRSPLGKRLYRDPGEALSSWSDANPEGHRLGHWIFEASGNASEVWVLFVVPASAADSVAPDAVPDVGRPRHRPASAALILVWAMANVLAVFFVLGFVVILASQHNNARDADLRNAGVTSLVLIAIVVGIQRFRRSPIRRRSRTRAANH